MSKIKKNEKMFYEKLGTLFCTNPPLNKLDYITKVGALAKRYNIKEDINDLADFYFKFRPEIERRKAKGKCHLTFCGKKAKVSQEFWICHAVYNSKK